MNLTLNPRLTFDMPLAPPRPTQSELGELFRVTDKIPGWLNVSERSIIYSLGKSTDGPVLEMGCFKGKSTTCFLRARKATQVAAHHVVVDLFKDHVDSGPGDFEKEFRSNVEPWIGKTDLHVLRMSTFEAGPPLRKILGAHPGFSGIFVDANHSYNSVLKDALLAHELVIPGGWIAFHDAIRWEGITEVLPACMEIPQLEPYGFVGVYASILLLRKPSRTERFDSWRQHPKIRAYASWGKSRLARVVHKGTSVVMGSPLGKVVSKGRSLVQKLKG